MAGIARHLDGFRVLIFDLPGHARSVRAPADGRLPSLAAILHEAINEAGADDYSLVG
ncbi:MULTISPECIES: alpha/beta fold hydrolase [unclassified Nonomuraea]